MFFRFSIRGVKNKFFLVADTARFSQHLTSSLGQKFMTFPMYSGLTPSLVIGKERNVNLVNIRGIRAERLFGRVIEIDPRLSKIDIEVHGILDEEIASQLATYPNITIFNKHLTEESYFASYERYSKVTFLYDPQFFAMQSSGRLADAIVSGATLLVPKDTSLEDVLIEYGNGSSFDFDDETSLILGLLSEPSISRKVDYLPTNHWAAQMILNSIENLKETVNQKKVNKVSKIAAHFLDDFVWLLVGLTRLLFGLQRRIKLLVAQSD